MIPFFLFFFYMVLLKISRSHCKQYAAKTLSPSHESISLGMHGRKWFSSKDLLKLRKIINNHRRYIVVNTKKVISHT